MSEVLILAGLSGLTVAICVELFELAGVNCSRQQPVKPDDHSEVVPLLPIPNRTVKRLSADDSADSRVKVGHRQATYSKAPLACGVGGFYFCQVNR